MHRSLRLTLPVAGIIFRNARSTGWTGKAQRLPFGIYPGGAGPVIFGLLALNIMCTGPSLSRLVMGMLYMKAKGTFQL